MKAIGWLLIFIGLGSAIDAYHGNSPYATISKYLSSAGGPIGAPQGADQLGSSINGVSTVLPSAPTGAKIDHSGRGGS